MHNLTVAEELLQYAEAHSESEPTLLHELRRETHLTQQQAHMLSGHLQGRLLSTLSNFLQPKKILELGTYTGYATLCLAEGLAKNGKIITIDCDEEKKMICEKYFAKSEYSNNIEMLVGNALDLLPDLDMDFDLVFIDADKKNYLNYYKEIASRVASGTCIIVDNTLFHGEVTKEKMSTNAAAVHDCNEYIKHDNTVQAVLLPVRDGLTVVRKK